MKKFNDRPNYLEAVLYGYRLVMDCLPELKWKIIDPRTDGILDEGEGPMTVAEDRLRYALSIGRLAPLSRGGLVQRAEAFSSTAYAIVAREGFTVVSDPVQDGMCHVYRDNGTRYGAHVHRFEPGDGCLIFWGEREARAAQERLDLGGFTYVEEVEIKAGVL